jgi:polyisoprenoid-binding protein YceI
MQTGAQKAQVPVKFKVDPSGGRFTVQAFATGLLSSLGHNPTMGIRDFDGEIEYDRENPEGAHVLLTVRTNAMEALDEMKGDDRRKLEQEMYGNVLESDRFPEAVYESKKIVVRKLGGDLLQAQVMGELTFHGVTQSHSFEARVTDMGTMLRISGEFPLKQSDYRIKPFSFAGGALRLKDDLKFSFELVARKQE